MAVPLLLGIEIGGTKLQLGLGRADGRLLALERRPIRPEGGAEAILQQIAEAFEPLLAQRTGPGGHPEAVGIGFGGPVDADRGMALHSNQIAGWDGFALADWIRRTLGIPRVTIQNDADTAGLGESRFGAGVGLSPVFYVTIGSGIGGGLIIDGQIYRGNGAGAAEIGQVWIDDRRCGPRRLEEIASGWSIGQRARAILADGEHSGPLAATARADLSKLDAKAVAQAAADGDPSAISLLATATQALGRALAHVVTLLAPRRIILGGGVSLIADELWLNPIREVVEAWVFPPFRGTFDLVSAQLGEEVVIHGALALADGLMKSR